MSHTHKTKLYLVRYSKPRATVSGQEGGGWIHLKAENKIHLKERAKRKGIKLIKIKEVKSKEDKLLNNYYKTGWRIEDW